LAIGLVAALLFGAGFQYGRWQERKAGAGLPRVIAADKEGVAKEEAPAGAEGTAVSGRATTIQVHVAGAVQRPGVYELPAGARVNEAVSLAGLLPEANANALNLAAPLNDGQQVIVPRQGETAGLADAGSQPVPGTTGSTGAGGVASSRGKVNINTAGLAELDTLPGIGPTLAQRILDYRREKGPFRTIEDLQNVSGIGPQKFADLKDLITVY
ncbi:MAG: helix-hairpin-helix domain-containing protein, partial [Moorella sp. (in: Bacteria)]|nr:helix-hairpin-helix domain-containing protein [Moorella sp. (in: firmicutes)]